MSFTSLGLSAPILQALADKGYETPSPIQLQAIPPVLEGRDVMAAAQTGTGKTAGFVLPILHRLSQGQRAGANQARALVLTPTRELAAQVAESVQIYGRHLPLRSAVVFGGVNINPQMIKLRKGVDILVATPGRLLDLYGQNAVRFQNLEVLVLDEADRMLDMGFIHDIKRILKLLPAKRQNLLFSATFSDQIRALAKGLVNNPVEVSVSPPNSTIDLVTQWVCPVDKAKKNVTLVRMISDGNWDQVLVFCKTKHGSNRLSEFLQERGINSSAIHGNKSQSARTKALAEFKQGQVRVLVATDIAARGLDIFQLPHVINFDLPNVPEDYVHRIGRTGRAGASGEAISLVSADEYRLLADIEKLIRKKLPRKALDGYEPKHDVPDRPLDTRPAKPKRPKKPRNPEHRSRSPQGQEASGRGANPQSARADTRSGPGQQRNAKPRHPRAETPRSGADRPGKPGGTDAPKNKVWGKPKSATDQRGPAKSGEGKRHSRPNRSPGKPRR